MSDSLLPCRLLLYGFARQTESLLISTSIIPSAVVILCIAYTFHEIEVLVTDYDILMRKYAITNSIERINDNEKPLAQQIKSLLNKIRSSVLLNGVPDNYSVSLEDSDTDPTDNDLTAALSNCKLSSNDKDDPLKWLSNVMATSEIKHNNTLRGKLWSVMLGLSSIKMDIDKYKSNMYENESQYVKIRGDSKRTFLKSKSYHSRVNESQLVRLLNVYMNMNPGCTYRAGTDCYAGILLYTMPELNAYYSFKLLMEKHVPTYYHRDSIAASLDMAGSFAGAWLAWDVLKIADNELFEHLKALPPYTYLWPPTASFQALVQPFGEMIKLWDFMICFGFHLSPIITVACVVNVKEQLIDKMSANLLLQGILSQRKWMNHNVDSSEVIEIAMDIIVKLKENDENKTLWNQILIHTSDIDVASDIKTKHDTNNY